MSTISLCEPQAQRAKEINELIDSVSPYYKEAIGLIKKISNTLIEDEKEMEDLLKSQQDRFEYNSHKWISGNSFENIWQIQAFVYDFYEFFTINLLPINYYRETFSYFSFYIESILCSYSPIKEENGFKLQTDRRPYALNEIDFDIFIKYSDYKSNQDAIKRYGVSEIQLENVDVAKKYTNYCESLKNFEIEKWQNAVNNFAIIFSLLKLNSAEMERVYSAFSSLLEYKGKYSSYRLTEIDTVINIMLSQYGNKDMDSIDSTILHTFLTPDVKKAFKERKPGLYSRILSKLKDKITEEDRQDLTEKIDNIADVRKKCSELYLYKDLIPIKSYVPFLSEHILEIAPNVLFNLVYDEIIPFDKITWENLVANVKKLVAEKKTGVYSYPDYLSWTIENCIIFKILNFPIDLKDIEFAKNHSEFLSFALDPENFDYGKVDFDNYMWNNFVYSKEYQHFFIEHKEQILTDELKLLISTNKVSNNVKKVIYGIILEKDKLRGY